MDKIEEKYKNLIDKAIEYMCSIQDKEHNEKHLEDVICFVKELLKENIYGVNEDVVILSAYWHDVGRIKTSEGHEKLSANMLKDELQKLDYDDSFIIACEKAIENHKWDMVPTTNEGWVLKDADKLAWLGLNRWKECLDNNQKLDLIMKNLPKLRNEILHFDKSKEIYDKQIVELFELLYKKEYEKI